MDEVIKHDESGFNFNKNLSFGTHEKMKLINLGTRYKLLFVIYGVGFYDSNKNYNKDTVYTSKSTKGLVLQFYRSVPLNSIIKTFKTSIQERNINNDNIINENIEYLALLFNEIKTINYKDLIHIIWENNALYIYYNNCILGSIESNEFAEIVFKCYLDKNSVINGLL